MPEENIALAIAKALADAEMKPGNPWQSDDVAHDCGQSGMGCLVPRTRAERNRARWATRARPGDETSASLVDFS